MRILATLVIILISFPAYAGTRAIATAPGEPTLYVEFTAEEQTQRDAEEALWLAAKPLRDWQADMDAINLSKDLENIIDALDAPTRARIPAETLDKYNAKKALRLSKP